MTDDDAVRNQASMQIHPQQVSVGEMLSSRGTIEVPKYQRNYAWDDSQVVSFLNDLDLCRMARNANKRRHHFFGGIVTAAAPVPGSTRQNNELIDGQQRLATFMMLIVQLKQGMLQLAIEAQATGNGNLHIFLTTKAGIIAERYETFRDTINMTVVPVPRIKMSGPDQSFFDALLRGDNPPMQRKSHRLLSAAFQRIGQHLFAVLTVIENLTTKAAVLETIMQVVEQDWTVIHMAANERKDAYMLYQVLNDRGLSLTEGELLRVSTLEAIEPVAPANVMEGVEKGWDSILSGHKLDIRKALHWAYASQVGDWPGRSTLLADLTRNLFPAVAAESALSRQQADEVAHSVALLERDFNVLGDMLGGDWPMPHHGTVRTWDKDRLRLLISHLQQHDCLPLLIAASLLPPQHFSEIVQALERFCFRYSVIVQAPPLEAIAIYNSHAVNIRRAPEDYRPRTLIRDLSELVGQRAPDDVFRDRLKELHYPRSESRKPLKYFLITLEHFALWFDAGAQGCPNCRDRTRVIDFENSTIEHIYAEHAREPDPQLEPYLDSLGNLAILGPEDNDAAGDKSFAEKKHYFAQSHSLLNRQIAEEAMWNVDTVLKRQARLVNMGMSVFRP